MVASCSSYPSHLFFQIFRCWKLIQQPRWAPPTFKARGMKTCSSLEGMAEPQKAEMHYCTLTINEKKESYNTISFHIIRHYTILCFLVSYYGRLNITVHCMTLFDIISFYIVSFYSIPFYNIWYYIKLFTIVLYHSIILY